MVLSRLFDSAPTLVSFNCFGRIYSFPSTGGSVSLFCRGCFVTRYVSIAFIYDLASFVDEYSFGNSFLNFRHFPHLGAYPKIC